MSSRAARQRSWARLALPPLLALLAAAPGPEVPPVAPAPLPVRELRLDNGMRFLLLQRPEALTVAAGWVAPVGSSDDPPGLGGLTHLVEHLLFKGTHRVGARRPEEEATLLARQDRVWAEIRRLDTATTAAAGERAGRRHAERRAALERELASLGEQARATTSLGELSLLYSAAGASGLDALTLQDLSLFTVSLPAERLELWFWLESDRLLEPVFRELFTEKEVIAEERGVELASTPTAAIDQSLLAHFWGQHPYSHPVIGAADELSRAGRPDVEHFFAEHYRAADLTAVLVGRFDPRQVESLARRYFGRLPATGPSRPAARPTVSPPGPLAGQTLAAACDCPAQIQVLYPTVAFGHPDADALELLAGVLNGRSGRLQTSLVLGRGIAFSGYALQHALRRGGFFSLRVEGSGGTDPATLVRAWDELLAPLAAAPLPAGELARVKTRVVADAYRHRREPEALLRQMLIHAGLGDWRALDGSAARLLAVGPEEIRGVVRRYLSAERRTVALYRPQAAAAAESPGAAQ